MSNFPRLSVQVNAFPSITSTGLAKLREQLCATKNGVHEIASSVICLTMITASDRIVN